MLEHRIDGVNALSRHRFAQIVILDRKLNVFLVVVLPFADVVDADHVFRVHTTRGDRLCNARHSILLPRRYKRLVNKNRLSVANRSLDGPCVPD